MKKAYLMDCKEIASIAVIMSDHILEKAYKFMQDKQPQQGYIDTCEMVGNWAIAFYEKFKEVTSWYEEVYENPKKWDLPPGIMEWDDCVMEFADQMYCKEIELYRDTLKSNTK